MLEEIDPAMNGESTDEDIEQSLDLLADGAYLSVPEGLDGLGQRVKAVANKLQERGRGYLSRMVGVSVNMNSAVIAAAEMTRDVREVDSRSHAIASATEEMVASVKEIASNSEAAAEEAQQARTSTSEGIEAANNAVDTMAGISSAVEQAAERTNVLAESSEQIGQIVNEIEAIAGQTNLLALNATIEAARAGEAGKGFAVVAAEVKSLATLTSNATEEISSHVGAIQAATNQSVKDIEIGRASCRERV